MFEGVYDVSAMTKNELRYYDALKQISKHDSPEWLVKNSERHYGLTYTEALEIAYENVIQVAKDAMRNKRKPKIVKSLIDRTKE